MYCYYMNSNNNNSKKVNRKSRMNKNISTCLKDCKLFQNDDIRLKDLDRTLYKNEEIYQKSFTNIIKFSKSIPEKDKKEINAVIFNTNNADGLFCAWVFFKFLQSNNLTSQNITFIPLGAASGNKPNKHLEYSLSQLTDKTVIILDIAYSLVNLELIASAAKKMYMIDDHIRGEKEMKDLDTVEKLKKNYFIGDDQHAAVAYTWKFFFPNEEVPILVQYIDNDDRKLNLPFLFYDRAFKTFLDFRFTHSPYIPKFNNIEAFEKLDKQVENMDKNFVLTVGHYYDELVNNIKDQVARNARFQYFAGHPVYALNYNDPVLTNMVGRQMITNAEKKGDKIDFAVLFGYEFTSNGYRVVMSEKHTGQLPRFNLGKLAEELARKGGHPMGGKGTKYIGNFYYPRDKNHDIWDLFGNEFKK